MNWKGSSEEGEMQVRTPNFSLGEEEGGRRKADPGKVHAHDLCLSSKILLQKSSCMCNCNITLFVTAFTRIYIQMYLHVT